MTRKWKSNNFKKTQLLWFGHMRRINEVSTRMGSPGKKREYNQEETVIYEYVEHLNKMYHERKIRKW